MKFAITASDTDAYFAIKEFQTVDDLMTFMKEQEYDLIITHNVTYEKDIEFIQRYNPDLNAAELVKIPYAIEIYNTYRE